MAKDIEMDGTGDVAKGVRHVLVRDLELPVEIGFYGHEKGRTQTVRINLDLSVVDLPVQDDVIGSVVDYVAVVNKVRKIAGGGHVNLVETLAERIAAICLDDVRVLKARIRVEKPDAIADAASAGVEIERFQSRV